MVSWGSLWSSPLGGLIVALGVGLLIGAERERSKGTGPARGAAGVRTFALVAVLGAMAGAIGSSVLLGVLAGGIDASLLLRLFLGLALMGAVAAAYGGLFVYATTRSAPPSEALPGRAFQPRTALVFALTVTTVLFLAAVLAERYGARGATLGIGLSGFADAHSASASAASLLSSGALGESGAALAVLLAVSANTVTKAVIAWASGGWLYARALWPGLFLTLAGLAAGSWLAGALYSS